MAAGGCRPGRAAVQRVQRARPGGVARAAGRRWRRDGPGRAGGPGRAVAGGPAAAGGAGPTRRRAGPMAGRGRVRPGGRVLLGRLEERLGASATRAEAAVPAAAQPASGSDADRRRVGPRRLLARASTIPSPGTRPSTRPDQPRTPIAVLPPSGSGWRPGGQHDRAGRPGQQPVDGEGRRPAGQVQQIACAATAPGSGSSETLTSPCRNTAMPSSVAAMVPNPGTALVRHHPFGEQSGEVPAGRRARRPRRPAGSARAGRPTTPDRRPRPAG